MAQRTRPRSLLIFYILVGYVTLQFLWWAWHIIDLTSEVYASEEIRRRVLMIVGEGSVFFILLAVGIFYVRKSFKKESELNQQQKNFLLSVSHELKSPIASTKLYLQTLEKRDIDRDKQKEIIQKALRESDRLSTLVDNILTATSMNESHYKLERQEINLSDYLHELLKDLSGGIGKSHKTEEHIENDIRAKVDPAAFESVLINLYDNAVKYSKEGSSISVHLEKDQENVILRVCDEGVGIAADNRDKVFNQFYREGDEEVRKAKGTGLGLFIVKNIIDLHGGTIKISDRNESGTCFEIIFKA